MSNYEEIIKPYINHITLVKDKYRSSGRVNTKMYYLINIFVKNVKTMNGVLYVMLMNIYMPEMGTKDFPGRWCFLPVNLYH